MKNMGKRIFRYVFVMFVFVATLMFVGCSDAEGAKISDYFPVEGDTVYRYEGNLSDYTDYVLFNQYINGDTFQRRLFYPSLATVEVMTHKNGELRLVYGNEQMYNHKSFLDAEQNTSILVLKEPLKLNASWVVAEGGGVQIKATVTAMNKEITIPYGTVKAMEITVQNPDGSKEYDYYVKGLGRVKYETITKNSVEDTEGNVLKESESGMTVELAEIQKNTSLATAFALFYPGEDGKLVYEAVNIEFSTNSDPDKVLIDAMKAVLNEKGVIELSDSTKVITVKNDFDALTAVIEMSSSFIDDIKNATAGEKLAFEAMVNTMCYYYYAEGIKFIVDGKEYKPDGVTYDENGFAPPIEIEEETESNTEDKTGDKTEEGETNE